jgi:hypothetical protein
VLVRASVRKGSATQDFVFVMEQETTGSKKGSWLTKQLLPADSKYLQ